MEGGGRRERERESSSANLDGLDRRTVGGTISMQHRKMMLSELHQDVHIYANAHTHRTQLRGEEKTREREREREMAVLSETLHVRVLLGGRLGDTQPVITSRSQ